jgi:hypothetical protein
MMRRIPLVVVALIVGACGGGRLTMSEYAAQAEDLTTEIIERIAALDAEWESQVPTAAGAQTYWEHRLEARVEFQEGFQALDPPEQAIESHEAALAFFSRLTAAERALAARAVTLDFEEATDHGLWWNTPEGRAALTADAEAIAICQAGQEEFDETQHREVFADTPWIPPEMKEVVQVALGCPE